MLTKHINQMDQDLEVVMKFCRCAEEDPIIFSRLCCQSILNHLLQAAPNLLLKHLASLWFDWKVIQSRSIAVWIPYGCLPANYVDHSLNWVFYILSIKKNALGSWNLPISTDLPIEFKYSLFCLIPDATVKPLLIFAWYSQLNVLIV